MHKKRPKICTCCRVSEAKFYLYHSIKIAKARPGFDDRPEHPSVQINFSSPWVSLSAKSKWGQIPTVPYVPPGLKQGVLKSIHFVNTSAQGSCFHKLTADVSSG